MFLSFRTVCAYPKLRQRQKIRFRARLALFEEKQAPVLGNQLIRIWENWFGFGGKSVTDLGEIRHRFWENLPPTLGKFVDGFSQSRGQISPKSGTDFPKVAPDFGEIRQRLWEICPRLWGNPSATLGKSVPDFGEICPRLWENPSPVLGK